MTSAPRCGGLTGALGDPGATLDGVTGAAGDLSGAVHDVTGLIGTLGDPTATLHGVTGTLGGTLDSVSGVSGVTGTPPHGALVWYHNSAGTGHVVMSLGEGMIIGSSVGGNVGVASYLYRSGYRGWSVPYFPLAG